MGNYCASGRPKDLIDLSNDSQAKGLKYVQEFINDGESCEKEGKYFEALRSFSKALALYEREENKSIQIHGYLLYKKAKNHLRLKENDHAMKSLKTILAIYTSNYKLKLEEVLASYSELKEYVYELAVLLFSEKQIDRSLFYFKFLIKSKTENSFGSESFLAQVYNYIGIIQLES